MGRDGDTGTPEGEGAVMDWSWKSIQHVLAGGCFVVVFAIIGGAIIVDALKELLKWGGAL